jgi:hypothetical protein
MNEPPKALQQLGDELERVAGTVLPRADGPSPGPRPSREPRPSPGPRPSREPRPSPGPRRTPAGRLGVLAVCILLLLLAAAATAAVLLIQQGSPLPAPHAQDLRSSGIPLPGSARLAGLDAPDPSSSNPPWDVRLSRTSSGETCTAVGQVFDGRFGIVGLDHVFRAFPLGSVDSCGIDSGDGPLLVGAMDFAGTTPSEARTVLSGVAGAGTRSVTAYGSGAPRHLKLGPQGSFITVYAGEVEEVRPRVVIAMRDGRVRTIALERSGAFEVPDPEGGGRAWAASTQPDLEPNAFPDEDCAQVTREPSQSEPSHVTLPLTPEICGRLGNSPLFVQMRRFVPGEGQDGPFPWNDSPSRTIVYGVAAPRVESLELSGAGAPRALAIDRQGGAFMAVLDGHVDPRSLTLSATLRGGAVLAYRRPTGLLSYRTNKPIGTQTVPAYRSPAPARATLPPPFELPIVSSVTQTLHASDPAGGPEWVLRSWQGSPNTSVRGVGDERFLCVQLGVLWHGRPVEPSATPSASSRPLSAEGGRCNQPKDLTRMRYTLTLESFLTDPYQYTPDPERAVLSGMLPPGARDPVLLGVGPARALPVDANNAFLDVLPGRFWDARPRISYILDGRRVGKLSGGGGSRRYLQGTEAAVPQVRAPDPDGAAPWGFAATQNCNTAIGRIVAGRLAQIDLLDGVLKPGAEITGSSSSCITHRGGFTPAVELHEPVEFDQQPLGTGEGLFPSEREPLRQPEVEWRTLPGRTVLTGVARADVVSVTLSTPSDVRTLRPSGPLHTILAVYDGYFLRGNLTATVRLRDGRVQTEQIAGYGPGAFQPESLSVQTRDLTQTLAQLRERARSRGGSRFRGFISETEARIHKIQRRVAYERAHPGLLPAE